VHGTNGAIILDNTEARYVFKRLKSHYKFGHALEIWGTGDGGSCSMWRVKVSYNPSLRILVHEVAHAIQWKKDRTHPFDKKKHSWHNKKHMAIMKRIYKYMMPRLEGWKAMANKKTEMHINSIRKKEDKKRELEEFRKTPKFRLQQIERRISAWESKRKRAENAIKKLTRRKRLWERKATGLSSQPLSSHPI
jgi:hypothetical protein